MSTAETSHDPPFDHDRHLRVSVVVPCYNGEDTIGRCLEAIASQTRRPDEVLVVDDASTDASAAVAEAGGARVVRRSRNGGISAARNTGIAAAAHEVVFFADADVVLRPGALAAALEVLEADASVDIVHGAYEPEPLDGDSPVERYLTLREVQWRRRHLGETNVVVFALAAVRASVFERFGPLDERLRDCEDVEYSARMAGRASIRISDRVTGFHDAETRLLKALAIQWRRAHPLPRLAAAAPPGPRLDRINRLPAIASAALGVAAMVLTPIIAPLGLAAPILLVAALGFDADLIDAARRRRGVRTAAQVALIHLCFLTVLAAGLAAGIPAALRARFTPASPTHWNGDHATH